MTAGEVDIVRRALALRKLGKIAVLLAECGHYWTTEDMSDPWGAKVSISLAALTIMVESAEAGAQKMPPQREKSNSPFDLKMLVELKNKASA